jgi:uncharacterized membrane protein (UPF0127 family)
VRPLVTLLALLVLAACTGDDEPAAPSGTGPEEGGPAAVIDTGEDEVAVAVEVADTPSERGRGLMFRESLPEDAGMIFLFEEPQRSGFWMKNTLIPLSIAFYDDEGKIVRILDMDPCRADPCPLYDPGVPYHGALEVNQGAFERWGVEAGDSIRLET